MGKAIDQEKHARWRQILEEFDASGLGVRSFCENYPLPEPQFWYWRKRLGSASSQSEPAETEIETPCSTPVVSTGSNGSDRNSSAAIEIKLASGHRLRVRSGCDLRLLTEVIALLEATSSSTNNTTAVESEASETDDEPERVRKVRSTEVVAKEKESARVLGLRLNHYRILKAIGGGSKSYKELESQTGINRHSMTSLLWGGGQGGYNPDSMTNLGLIKRHKDDERGWVWTLTPKGVELLNRRDDEQNSDDYDSDSE